MLFSTFFSTLLVPFFVVSVAASANWTSDPYEPAAIPLAVRSPYLNAWLAGGQALHDTWPTMFQGSIVGWGGYVRVDGVAYRTMGAASIDGQQVASQTNVKITASTSEFTLTAGSVELVYTFLSPVEFADIDRLSLPLSYMSVAARSTDGSKHTVQVYADVSAEWVSGDDKNVANWTVAQSSDGKVLSHKVQRADAQVFGEISDHSEYGILYFSTALTSSLTYSQGEDVTERTAFVQNGQLDGQTDTNYRAIGDNWPVFAFATTLDSVSGNGQFSDPVVFAIGHFRDPMFQMITKSGTTEDLSPYWMTKYSTAMDAISFFLNDYDNAVSSANSLNTKITTDAGTVSGNYVNVLKLSLRQAVGAIELAVRKNSDGTLDFSNPLAFMKEISSSSNINTVDVIYPFWPLAVYGNPQLGQMLLEPLLEYAAFGTYPNHWAVHDIGSSYPNATGHNDGKDEQMPVEETGNMLIMALSAAQQTGNYTQLTKYFNNFYGWAQYLEATTLLPANQLSTDDFAGSLANETNLAVKGIIGIGAFAQIANLTGNTDKGTQYTGYAKDLVARWRAMATSLDRKHLRLTYNNDSTYGLMYNLYADKLLGLNLIPDDIYTMQTAFYKTKLQKYGIILDTRADYTKSDWQMWVAAAGDSSLQSSLVDCVASYSALADPANSGMPFGDWYNVTTGASLSFRGRPVVGGHFAIVALTSKSIASMSTTDSSSSTSGGSSSTGDSGTSGGNINSSSSTTDEGKDDSAFASAGAPHLALIFAGLLALASFLI